MRNVRPASLPNKESDLAFCGQLRDHFGSSFQTVGSKINHVTRINRDIASGVYAHQSRIVRSWSAQLKWLTKVCGNNDSNDSLLRTIKISILIKLSKPSILNPLISISHSPKWVIFVETDLLVFFYRPFSKNDYKKENCDFAWNRSFSITNSSFSNQHGIFVIFERNWHFT